MPVLKIVHAEAKYEDSLSGQLFDSMDVILLGLIKQRTLWPSEVDDSGDAPVCRSYNSTIGMPSEKFLVPDKSSNVVPGQKSGFSREEVQAGNLPCASCALKEWDSHPTKGTPWCSEQYTVAVLVTEPGEPLGAPAILTLQRSAIKPAKQYFTSFATKKNPLYVARTTISLQGQRKGSVAYAVPKFSRTVDTDPGYHELYGDLFRQVRDFVRTPRTNEGETETEVSVTVNAGTGDAEPIAADTTGGALPW